MLEIYFFSFIPPKRFGGIPKKMFQHVFSCQCQSTSNSLYINFLFFSFSYYSFSAILLLFFSQTFCFPHLIRTHQAAKRVIIRVYNPFFFFPKSFCFSLYLLNYTLCLVLVSKENPLNLIVLYGF